MKCAEDWRHRHAQSFECFEENDETKTRWSPEPKDRRREILSLKILDLSAVAKTESLHQQLSTVLMPNALNRCEMRESILFRLTLQMNGKRRAGCSDAAKRRQPPLIKKNPSARRQNRVSKLGPRTILDFSTRSIEYLRVRAAWMVSS